MPTNHMENLIHRARNLLCFEPFGEVVVHLLDKGDATREEAYCAVIAAKILLEGI